MSLRFRQTFTLFRRSTQHWQAWNKCKHWRAGATVNVGKRVRATVGLPGTGLSYTTPTLPYDDGYSVTNPLNPAPTEPHLGSGSSPENTPSNAKIYMPVAGMNEISSASVEVLTSTSLLPLRDLIAKAREQRAEIKADLQEALAEESKQKKKAGSTQIKSIPLVLQTTHRRT